MVIIKWSKKANKKRIAFLEYGRQEFGTKAARQLNERIESYVKSLASNPLMGKVEPLLQGRRKQYRSLVVNKLLKLIYRIDESTQTLYIADLWDTRREPAPQANGK